MAVAPCWVRRIRCPRRDREGPSRWGAQRDWQCQRTLGDRAPACGGSGHPAPPCLGGGCGCRRIGCDPCLFLLGESRWARQVRARRARSGAGNRWFILGLVGGLVLGAGAAWLVAWGRRGSLVAIIAGLMMLEPVARLVWAATKNNPLGTYVPDPVVWVLEIVGGCALAAFGLRFQRALHR